MTPSRLNEIKQLYKKYPQANNEVIAELIEEVEVSEACIRALKSNHSIIVDELKATLRMAVEALKYFFEVEAIREKCSDCEEPYQVEDFHSHLNECKVDKAEQVLSNPKVKEMLE